MGGRTAAALVFGSSAAVLVVELVALRLLAPYLGLTLETNTLVIAIALGAIAAGSWLGGRAADAVPPGRVLGGLLGVSGVVVAATPFLVRAAGATPDGSLVVPVAALTILVPGLLLSAVTPMVTKLRLTTLAETGAVVGRLSGVGTAGAIVGTVLTGFVLISRVPVTAIMVGLGVLLVLAGLLVEVRRVGAAAAVRSAGPAVVLVALGGVAGAVGPGGCDVETTYHCASVETDPDDPDGRTLVLDGLRHSYVDVSDPTRLEFDYVKGLAAVTQAAWPDDEPLTAHHLGGGGLTLPRWLAAERPGTVSTVSEIDPGVVALDRDRLALETGPELEVRVEDARLGLREVPDDSQDLVVGDAFGGISVPWHLTTREMVAEIDRVLAPDGVYAANLIDHGPLAFARAEVATLAERFDHVAVLAEPGVVVGSSTRPDGVEPDGGNLVAVASDRALDPAGLTRRVEALDLDWVVATGADVADWVDGADVLTDDRAPVDQLLTPYSTTPSSQTR